MYTSFYGMTEKPFQISTDPRFLWMGEKHREALANLKYGLMDRNGFVVLTGDAGTGKTTLVNALLEALGENVCVAKINHPSLETNDFLSLIARLLDPGFESTNKRDLLLFFNAFLQQSNADGKVALLIIDEAHRLPMELLEEIRLLSNIEHRGQNLLSIFFVGQDEIKPMLRKPECRALRQRITSYYDIDSLLAEETQLYVEHRLKVSGVRQQVFTVNALRQIYALSHGNPRVINNICDRALLTGYVREQRTIDADIIIECGEELQLDTGSQRIDKEDPDHAAADRESVLSDKLRAGATSVRKWLHIILERSGTLLKKSFIRGRTIVEKGFEALVGLTDQSMGNHRRKLILGVLLAGCVLVSLAVIAGTFTAAKNPDPSSGKNQNEEMAHVAGTPQGSAVQESVAAPSATDRAEDHPGISDTTALSGTPKPPEAALVEKAVAAMVKSDFKSAIELLESTPVGAASENAKESGLYAQALVGRAIEIMATSPAEAEALLIKASEVAPLMTDPYLLLGKRYIRIKDYPKAIDAYQKAISLDATSADAFFNIGFIYATIGEFEAAEKAFEKVVSLKPAYIEKSLFNLAVIQQKLGKKAQSIANLEEVVALSPENEKALAYLNRLREASTPDHGKQR